MTVPVDRLDRWKKPVFEFDSVVDFVGSPLSADGIYTVAYEGTSIDMLVAVQPGKPLVVSLNGAITDRTAVTPPVFGGIGVLADCDASVLCINDPTVYLSDSLGLAWYAGWDGVDLHDALVRLIASVSAATGAPGIAFMGGSGGGYAALSLSSVFPGSLAVVWNPQTDIFAYVPQYVRSYTSVAWGTEDFDEAKAKMPRHEIIDLYSRPQSNRVLYLQNRGDWHVEAHLTPLLDAMASPSPQFQVQMCDFGVGHAGPSKGYLQALLPRLINGTAWNGDFDAVRSGAIEAAEKAAAPET